MAQLQGVTTEKLQGGLNRQSENTDSHFAYIVGGIAELDVDAAVNNNNQGVRLNSVYDAEQLGFNESFDSNNTVNFYHEITEFFRFAPQGSLYLFNKITEADITEFLLNNKDVKGYAVEETIDVGQTLEASIAKHQTIVNALAAQNRLIDTVLVCPESLADFTVDLRGLEAPQLSVLIASSDAVNFLPAWGSVLGMLAVRKISENLGSVDIENKPVDKRGTQDYTLTDSLAERWLNAFLIDGRSVDSLNISEVLDIISKGYIMAASYQGYSGYFFENSHTCIDKSSDFAYIENNRVWNKAARIIRTTLLPRVKSKVKKDPTTGFIASTTVSYWTGLLNKALESMIVEDNISGFEVSINEKQIVNSEAPVKVKAEIVADGIVHSFEVAVGLTNNI